MNRNRLCSTPCMAAALALWAVPTCGQSGPPATTERTLYLAAVAAAESALRLHETEAARHWLAVAPAVERGWEWRYLAARLDDSSLAIEAHTVAALGVDLSPDGATIATSGGEGELRLWSAADGAPLRQLEGHTGNVWSARFSPDGQTLASSASDGTVRLWNVQTGNESRRIEEVGRGISALAWSPDGQRLATASWKRDEAHGVVGLIQFWEAATGRKLRQLIHGVKPIVAIAWSPDGNLVAAGTWDFDVALVDPDAGQLVDRLVPPVSESYKAVQSVAFSRDGSRLAVGAKDGTLRIWSVGRRALEGTYIGQAEGASRWINGVTFVGPDQVATAGADGTLRLRDVANGRERAVFHGATRPLTAVVASPSGERLLTVSSDGSCRSWDLVALAPERRTWAVEENVFSLAFHRDGRLAVTAGWGGDVTVYDSASGGKVRTWQGHRQSGVGAAWSRDGEYIATSGNDGAVVLWRASSGERIVLLGEAGRQVASVAISPDSRFVVAATTPGKVTVWEIPSGRERATFLADNGEDTGSVAWSPDGRFVAIGGSQGNAWRWDWQTGGVAQRFAHGKGRLVVAISPDGRTLATGSSAGTLALWSAQTGELRARLAGHTQAVDAVAFSPDGLRLASGGGDDTLRLWDPRSAEQVLALPIGESIWALAWSPDGERLGVVTLARKIRLLAARRPG